MTQAQQEPQQQLQEQSQNLLVVGELATAAALALADPLQCPHRRPCPKSVPPEEPVIALAALAVVAVPVKVL